MHTSAHDANVVGALGLLLADLLADAAEPVGGSSAAAALVAIAGTTARGSIDALARVVGLSHSGTVRLVDRLVRDGLVERRRGADQRSAALVLTPAGRRAARRVLARREANVQSALAMLTDGQRAALAEIGGLVVASARRSEARLCRLCDVEACGRRRGSCPVMSGRREPIV